MTSLEPSVAARPADPALEWQWRYRWSIAIYSGPALTQLAPIDPRGRPTLTPRHVTDRRAAAVADPFVIRTGESYLMFFEVLDALSGRGVIAHATSEDGQGWRYEGVVLEDSIHLSYPQVFYWQGAHYMIPETRQAAEVRLYRADRFPGGWRQVGTLLKGSYADATLHAAGGLFWLFAQRGLDEMRLFFAEAPTGPWTEHPASPLWAGNRRASRPGGRLIEVGGRTLRPAQDGWPTYGTAVRLFEIKHLDRARYEETELAESPILTASKSGWNALGMHHIELIRADAAGWLVAVDGATVGPIAPAARQAAQQRLE
ncbi:glucosamine inositolphosphorylceramide transferase family protein [Poseidonocella sedimentorum]|uniref:Glucosamine inositolphosphorylceramide transferase 1 N-terminal domain-containing protein n=1 Tax=Poseidonocella sedimentorum TaxID=871652 RepID=A0A1I6DL47_9RHOB|nr:hypothetical protein [Poseidonocella sedimentorum]SFR06111.1 hypothetical protein SAMN04515673_10448 [Poseidonocella sedimentorum]